MDMKNPGKSRNLLGFSPIYTIKGIGEISLTNKQRGICLGCDNFYICTIADYTPYLQELCARLHIIVIFLEYCLF